MDVDLDIVLVTYVEGAGNDRWRRAPVFVKFQTRRPRLHNILQCRDAGIVALTGESKVHRKTIGRGEHLLHVERTRGACRRVGSCTRTSTTTDHRRRARCERLRDLLRADIVTVSIDGTGGDDELLSRDDFCGRADDEVGVDSGHDIWVAGLANSFDLAILDTDVRLRDGQQASSFS